MTKTSSTLVIVGLMLALALGVFSAGCETTDESNATVGGGVYYGVALEDPWYDGAYYPPDAIVLPPGPGDLPDTPALKPEHPIASPPPVSVAPQPTPMPSIPSMPRVSPRR
jgi:hypothetical protein